MAELLGRVIVLTGCMGFLGGQFRDALLDAGSRVVGIDSRKGAEVMADVASESEMQDSREYITERFGPVRGLVCAHGIDRKPEDPDAPDWDNTLRVNLTGTEVACRVFAPAIGELGGSIVNIASIYGVVAPDQTIYGAGEAFKPAAYSASKAGVIGLTRWLAVRWAPGVRVNSISPGGMNQSQDADFVRRYSSRVPLGRMARSGEFDGAVLWLLSDASSYVTGANIVVDGGLSAW